LVVEYKVFRTGRMKKSSPLLNSEKYWLIKKFGVYPKTIESHIWGLQRKLQILLGTENHFKNIFKN
jgi:hypothetical protein